MKYATFKGWKTSTTNIKNFNDLPKECQEYINFIEKFINVTIKFLGVGPSRENLIVRD